MGDTKMSNTARPPRFSRSPISVEKRIVDFLDFIYALWVEGKDDRGVASILRLSKAASQDYGFGYFEALMQAFQKAGVLTYYKVNKMTVSIKWLYRKEDFADFNLAKKQSLAKQVRVMISRGTPKNDHLATPVTAIKVEQEEQAVKQPQYQTAVAEPPVVIEEHVFLFTLTSGQDARVILRDNRLHVNFLVPEGTEKEKGLLVDDLFSYASAMLKIASML